MSLRSAVIVGTAFLSGGAVGTFAEGVASKLGYSQPGVGHLAAGVAALWVAEKLDRLIAAPTDVNS